MTLMMTPQAAETIRLLVDQPGADGVRIFHSEVSADGTGLALQIALVPAPQPGDSMVEAAGARLYLDADAERAMGDKVLHADVDGGQVRFEVLEQPDDQPRG